MQVVMQRGAQLALAVLVLAALALACVACGDDGDGAVTTETEATTVALTLEAERAGGAVVLTGTTDLPDGALLAYEVSRDYGDEALPADPWWQEGTLAVEGGAYRAEIADAPRGTIEAWVAFQTILGEGTQPADVLETFGEAGERLSGENVSEAGGLKRVELTATVE